jgi:hypothetical protein
MSYGEIAAEARKLREAVDRHEAAIVELRATLDALTEALAEPAPAAAAAAEPGKGAA